MYVFLRKIINDILQLEESGCALATAISVVSVYDLFTDGMGACGSLVGWMVTAAWWWYLRICMYLHTVLS